MHAVKRKALSAIIGGLGVASGAADAVYENPRGVGQALIYPYYTVQTAGGNSFNTYLSVANTTARAKVVRVRFREGRNAREVLSFNLYLSPNDVWTAAMGPADATPFSPAVLVTRDASCTAPPIPQDGIAFRNYAYAGAAGDGGAVSLDRTREGYFEIIEMANLVGPAASAVTHTAAGSPANCAVVQPQAPFTAATNAASLAPPSGGLIGTWTLINVANGLNFGGNATALAQFSSAPIFADLGSDLPDLGSANPPIAMMTGDNPGNSTQYIATYANGRDAVSATLMRAAVINEFVLDTATKSATDWVLTFPTKFLYAARGAISAAPPFTNTFGPSGACEPASFTYFNREEASVPQPDTVFLLPPGPPPPNLCWAAQVLTIANLSATQSASPLLGSLNFMTTAPNNYQNGWARLSFPSVSAATTGLSSVAGGGTAVNANTGAIATGVTVNQRGLPVVGFMARSLNNGALSCTTFSNTPGVCAGTYGAAFDHKYQTVATPTP